MKLLPSQHRSSIREMRKELCRVLCAVQFCLNNAESCLFHRQQRIASTMCCFSWTGAGWWTDTRYDLFMFSLRKFHFQPGTRRLNSTSTKSTKADFRLAFLHLVILAVGSFRLRSLESTEMPFFRC